MLKLLLSVLSLLPLFVYAQRLDDVRDVIRRFAGTDYPVSLAMDLPKQNECDVYETSVVNGKLKISGSSEIALCRGFYDFVKSKNGGISSWSGNRYAMPENLEEEPVKRVVSPFKYHYYFNVVTFGYTMAYWDWERWEKEIDWMSLHGIDMPLALVANEAISARVWKKLGLTDEEIASYFVGPAHFPWMRMGNISGIDGPLPDSWHDNQIKLQHKILKRMKALGMKPICPGFAGFIPKALKRVFPKAKILETSWSGGAFNNWMLSPDEKLFGEIGRAFIEEWENEFGANEHYIVDSFNEMEIPFPPKGTQERYALLANYGKEVYASIKRGNPNATWVMQGWMFGYQRDIWDYETLQALVSKVPDDKMLLLDLAADYNHLFWDNGANWDHYKGFYNKEWVYSVIPNMGGKTGLTGDLEFYANGRLKALNSPNKGRLSGYGMAPEGIENNELLYELITDAGWTSDSIHVDKWLKSYALNRYGFHSSELETYWDGLKKSVYGSFTDHPRYNWQFRPGIVAKGSINANAVFYEGIESLLPLVPKFNNSPLFVLDFTEMTAHYIGGKMEILIQAIDKAYLVGDQAYATSLEKQFVELALEMDAILNTHSTLRLENWLDFAVKNGDSQLLNNYYEKNARRLITIWGPPVDDYSARIWSGLIRDYYVPRWQYYFNAKKSNVAFDFTNWEKDWVENRTGVSAVKTIQDITSACVNLINEGKKITPSLLTDGELLLGTWTNVNLSSEWKEITWIVPTHALKEMKGIQFLYSRGRDTLLIKDMTFEMDGKIVFDRAEELKVNRQHKAANYFIKVPSHVQANNSCLIRAKIKSTKDNDSYGQILMIKNNNTDR